MRILHICNDFCGSKVHANLYKELDRLAVRQTVFTCYRGSFPDGTNRFDASCTDFIYRRALKLIHRFLFHSKIKLVYRELINSVNPYKYDLIHAVTLFSDGAVAYKLYKEFGIPYVISVRNTDINEFLAVAPHTWPLGMNVLRNARKIIFISKAPKEKFCKHFLIKQILPEIQERFLVQPNGIDSYWLERIYKGKPNLNHNIIYVGRLDHNKNVLRLIRAVLELRKECEDIRLHIVGGDGGKELKIKCLADENKDAITYHGKIYDKDRLCELYHQCSLFAMPSIHETFGLVYLEALSQNLAVLYTKNQGIDGLFDARVGESVNALSVRSIKEGLNKLLVNRSSYSSDSVDFSLFNWPQIAMKYKSMYEHIIALNE